MAREDGAVKTREELIEAATPVHDAECSCDRRYRMSCPVMAAAILSLGKEPDGQS
jgi:hypothetical protein